jgi:hypothetical protein
MSVPDKRGQTPVQIAIATGASREILEILEVEDLYTEKPVTSKAKAECKRRRNCAKFNTFHEATATVIGYQPGKGRRSHGITGALKCRISVGKTFKVGLGLSREQRINPPEVGSIITYQFKKVTEDGKPRRAVYKAGHCDAVCRCGWGDEAS